MPDVDARTAALAEVGRLTLEAAADPAVRLFLVYEMVQPTIRYWSSVTDPDADPEYAPDVSEAPEAFRAKAEEIVDRFDDMRCDSCRGYIGYLLTEDDDNGPSQAWRTPWLIKGPSGGVAAVCEDCAPVDMPAPKVES